VLLFDGEDDEAVAAALRTGRSPGEGFEATNGKRTNLGAGERAEEGTSQGFRAGWWVNAIGQWPIR
jgi:hypothetical protein